MTTDATQRRRRRPMRVLLSLLLLGTIAAALVLLVPGLLRTLQDGNSLLPQFSECTVDADETIGLDRDEAKLGSSLRRRWRYLTAEWKRQIPPTSTTRCCNNWPRDDPTTLAQA